MSLQRSKRKFMNVAPTVYSVACDVEVMADGYVGTVQNYDSFGPTYAPDYTLSGLPLFPKCQLIDPDSPVAAMVCNEKLSSFEWREVTSSGETVIYAGDTVASGYEVVTSGERKGQLTVKKNGTVGVPRAVRFSGIYTEGGHTYRFTGSMPLKVADASSPGAELTIDSDKTMVYNPLRMQPNQTVVATVMKGGEDITNDERTKLLWYRRDEDGTETLLTAADDAENIEVVSATRSKNGSIVSLTIDRDLIGEGQTYGVYALYRANKVFPNAPEATDARAYTTIKRQFPQLFVEIQGDGLHSETEKINARAIVSDNQGVIDGWNEHLYASWKVGDGTSEKEVARGEQVMLDLEKGKSFWCDICDRGTYKVLASDSGEWLVDEEGSPIMERDYEGD